MDDGLPICVLERSTVADLEATKRLDPEALVALAFCLLVQISMEAPFRGTAKVCGAFADQRSCTVGDDHTVRIPLVTRRLLKMTRIDCAASLSRRND